MRRLIVLTVLLLLGTPIHGAVHAGAEGQNAGGTTTPDGGQVVVVVPGSDAGGYSSDGYKPGGGSGGTANIGRFADERGVRVPGA